MSLIIWGVSYTIVKYLFSDYIKVPKSPEEVEHSTFLFLEIHGFPQCLGAIDRTHTEVMEPQCHYNGYINRKRQVCTWHKNLSKFFIK